MQERKKKEINKEEKQEKKEEKQKWGKERNKKEGKKLRWLRYLTVEETVLIAEAIFLICTVNIFWEVHQKWWMHI